MKWGKKKPSSSSSAPSSSSSSHPHLISHVFPLSWFSKSKQTSEKPASSIPKTTQKGKQSSPKLIPKSPISSTCSTLRENKFYTQDNDGFWRLSFGNEHEESIEPDHHYCGNCKSNIKQLPVTKKRSQNKSNGYKKHDHPRELPSKEGAKDEGLERTYRRIIEATSKLQSELGQVSEIPSEKSEWEKLKEAKIREFHSKSEKQRKSFHISREYSQLRGFSSPRQGKIRVQSPRTPNSKTETCKIKALENLKKKKNKKKMKEMALLDEKAAAMESFAVVKCSRDPQQDFRDSMLEMIIEKRIRRPEELEELLACYLTLNADEYHDLIIKVFRQVWCELDESYFDQKLAEEQHYCDNV